MSPELIAGVTFVSVLIILYALFQFIRSESLMRSRLANLREQPQDSTQQEHPSAQDRMPTLTEWISGKKYTEGLLLSLIQAGVKLRPSEFIGIVTAVTLVLMVLAAFVMHSKAGVVLAVIIGVMGPTSYLNLLKRRRVLHFNRQLPDALSLMSSSLRSGYSFLRALQMVANEMPNPVAEECQRVINETNVGVPLESALQHLLMRVRSYDLELVVTAVLIQQQIGGNLSEVLDNIAETIRQRVRVEGEIAALTAEGRLSGVLLIALPIFMALIISILNPSYIRLLITEPMGRFFTLTAVVFQFIGALIIRKILTLDF